MAMNSAGQQGSFTSGMNCSINWEKQRNAFTYAQLEVTHAAPPFSLD